jgi:expansin (peptidoglycan-binding protein)
MSNPNRRNQPIGAVRSSDANLGGWSAGTTGAQMTMTPQRGLGASMVTDLDAVKARYARVKAAERHADRAYEAELRRAEREAEAAAALDELLDTL